MAENDSRKSMDDVLASIRRIVRAEREAEGDGPSGEIDDVAHGTDDHEDPGGDAPLALTPDMMSDDDVDSPPAAARVPPPASSGPPPGLFNDPVADDAGPAMADTRPRASDLATFVSAPDPVDTDYEAPPPPIAAPAISDDMLREMVREVISEELANGDAKGLVREIIKAELTTGEIGANISRNVLRLIRSEVAKANG